jgi:lysophospholipase II
VVIVHTILITRIILTTAFSSPKIPLTLNKGFAMPAWFDLSTLNEDAPENESEILRAVDNVHALLDEELAKTRLPPKKLLLGGFSQGGALALYAALTYHRPLAGILILSCWIPLHKTFPDVSHN